VLTFGRASHADTTAAGGAATARWLLGNDSDAPYIIHWTLNNDEGWPGLPLVVRVLP
jgi:hypothetical protein